MSILNEAMLQRLLRQGNTVIIIKKDEDELEDSFKDRLMKKRSKNILSVIPSPVPG